MKGGGRVDKVLNELFGFKKYDFNAFGSKKLCLKTRLGFFLNNFTFQSLRVLKTGIFEIKMSHKGGGGDQKRAKKCRIFLNGPSVY